MDAGMLKLLNMFMKSLWMAPQTPTAIVVRGFTF